jgi:tetraacyldisaccharide 4'-kinase
VSTSPDFWWRKAASPAAVLLAIPSYAYGIVSGRRMLAKHKGQVRCPVICIGNFVVGGAGKTPFALRLADRLMQDGRKPGFLLRGYGGREKGPLKVDLERHVAMDVGDEALLLAARAPTVVSADRVAGANALVQQDIDTILMDDGFQNPSLRKDLSIVLVDAETGAGNGFCLPAGPLRAPIATQILKADALVVVGEGAAADEVVHLAARRGLPILSARIVPVLQDGLKTKPLYAFAGIGRPDKFFRSLADLGLEVAETRAFADHHMFSEKEAEQLLVQAEKRDLQLVTTAKDMVRLKSEPGEIFRWLADRSMVLDVEMAIGNEDRLMGLVQEKIRQRAFVAG